MPGGPELFDAPVDDRHMERAEELHRRLMDAIAALNPNDTHVLVLRYVHNRSDAEIGRIEKLRPSAPGPDGVEGLVDCGAVQIPLWVLPKIRWNPQLQEKRLEDILGLLLAARHAVRGAVDEAVVLVEDILEFVGGGFVGSLNATSDICSSPYKHRT